MNNFIQWLKNLVTTKTIVTVYNPNNLPTKKD